MIALIEVLPYLALVTHMRETIDDYLLAAEQAEDELMEAEAAVAHAGDELEALLDIVNEGKPAHLSSAEWLQVQRHELRKLRAGL